VVAVDGGVFKHYTHYRNLMMAALVDMMGQTGANKVSVLTVRDGSSMGAAYLAAAAAHAVHSTKVNDGGGPGKVAGGKVVASKAGK
jgi:hexokinase